MGYEPILDDSDVRDDCDYCNQPHEEDEECIWPDDYDTIEEARGD